MSIMTDSCGRGIGADNPLPIQSVQKKFRDSFTTPNLDTTKWTIVSQGTGQTIAQSGGILTLGAGTTANAELIIESKDCYSVPLRLMFGFQLSQRIANQDFYVELISCDKETRETHPYNTAHICAWKFNGTTVTTGNYEVTNAGLTRLSASGTTITSASYSIKEIEMFSDEIWFHDRVIDSTAGRSASWVRHQQIPDPNLLYKIRLRIKNGGTAPASNTNFQFQYMTCIDYVELTTEITASRGSGVAGMGMPVTVTTMPALTMLNPTTHNLNAGATTNATSIKTTAGNVFSVTASNIGSVARYLKLYNKASAPTVGTDVPLLTIPLPAGQVANVKFGTHGFRFATGIALAVTTNGADSDTTVVSTANEVKVLTSYI